MSWNRAARSAALGANAAAPTRRRLTCKAKTPERQRRVQSGVQLITSEPKGPR